MPNPDSRSPMGYRVTDRRRLELQMAATFTNRQSLQDVVDLAVSQLLEQLREVEGFTEAVANAEKESRRRAEAPAVVVLPEKDAQAP